MKKEFEAPSMKIALFRKENVMTTSAGTDAAVTNMKQEMEKENRTVTVKEITGITL